ncbi:MAG: hypothetical protein IT539_04730 [Bradyrhizobiaceae bacterium]|nr:hypothetical protein [Bradyrhizobiaceae bacterium]
MRAAVLLHLIVFPIVSLGAVAAGPAPANAASCEVRRRPIVVAVDADVDMIVRSGQDCRVQFPKAEGFEAEQNEIGVRPHYGGVRVGGPSAVYYRSNPGYKGPDRFSFTLCGADGEKRGCSEVRVQVNVR